MREEICTTRQEVEGRGNEHTRFFICLIIFSFLPFFRAPEWALYKHTQTHIYMGGMN